VVFDWKKAVPEDFLLLSTEPELLLVFGEDLRKELKELTTKVSQGV
jgi:hypothetical protein